MMAKETNIKKKTKKKSLKEKIPKVFKGPVPVPQRVRWNSGYNREGGPGLEVESEQGVDFIPWEELKLEIENELFYHLGRVLGDAKYTAELSDFHGRKNHLMGIVKESGEKVGSIWLGTDPYSGWKWDGLVRVGKAINEHEHKVWQIFERYSDRTYRRIEALDTPEDRISN